MVVSVFKAQHNPMFSCMFRNASKAPGGVEDIRFLKTNLRFPFENRMLCKICPMFTFFVLLVWRDVLQYSVRICSDARRDATLLRFALIPS